APDGAEIAIVGISCRFPLVTDLEQYWRLLRDGVEALTHFSDEELAAAGVAPETLANPAYVKVGSVLEGIDGFDAGLFGYSPREAEILDPQQRFFLECAWESLEHAGYDSQRYRGRIGVFAGSNLSTYLFNLLSNPELQGSVSLLQMVLGNEKDSLTTTASYKLNLRGPSLAVQTFCSTSLVAVHLACRSLQGGESDLALAGGVRIAVPHRVGYLYEEGGIEPPDGRCRAFDADGKGSVLGNGVGIVVLKRLEDALADGDTIHAVIKGSSINNDGSLKVGYTAPSVEGQALVVEAALEAAGVDPASIGYLEAHGTGTPLGDPVEIAALSRVFGRRPAASDRLPIGSVKTNFGHLDRAAGVSGLIKAVLALRHQAIPPSLHFERPNPNIDFEHGPFYVNTRLAEWPAGDGPRRACVNSVGMGGTNAHVVLEEAPPAPPADPSRPWQLLLLSARTATALEAATARLAGHLDRHPEIDLADAAYTLQIGRRVLGHRRMLVCRSREEACEALARPTAGRVYTGFGEASQRPVVFMFPGLGDHYAGMAAGLYRDEPAFRRAFDRCSELLRPHLELDLGELLYAGTAAEEAGPAGLDFRRLVRRGSDGAAGGDPRLRETWLAQPAVFAVEYALAQLLIGWGIRPQAVIGYSLGEYVAACLAGVLSLDSALLLVARRARLISQLPAGAMLAVALPEGEAAPLAGDELSLAAVNGPALSVWAGPVAAVEALERRLAERGVAASRLQTSHAFHSRMMDPAAGALIDLVATVELSPPRIPCVSNVTGTWITAEEATDPAYWARHMCEAVRFGDGLAELLGEAERVLLEVGPGQALVAFARQHPGWDGDARRLALPTLRHEHFREPDTAFLLGTLGRLWLAGVEVDWESFHAGERRRRVALPTYPFEHQRYWIEGGHGIRGAAGRPSSGGKRPDVADWFYLPVW
ncbi:MAG TPA: type I polyketide synthase, partial [Thermoanaerobaculia bacterium]|nr:type I polyketide synthase [Thermoanaerobaculia bacterium]